MPLSALFSQYTITTDLSGNPLPGNQNYVVWYRAVNDYGDYAVTQTDINLGIRSSTSASYNLAPVYFQGCSGYTG
jgi:hypothetical protein